MTRRMCGTSLMAMFFSPAQDTRYIGLLVGKNLNILTLLVIFSPLKDVCPIFGNIVEDTVQIVTILPQDARVIVMFSCIVRCILIFTLKPFSFLSGQCGLCQIQSRWITLSYRGYEWLHPSLESGRCNKNMGFRNRRP